MKARLLPPLLLFVFGLTLRGQTLLNVDFGAGSASRKIGFAATGQSTNDYWNLYRHYDPKYVPGSPLVFNGEMANLKLADGSDTKITLVVTNAPGVWGNATGDPMYDSYVYAQNGSNITVTISNLDPGRYNIYLYGHADPDSSGEQNSTFRLQTAGTNYGSLTVAGGVGWKASQPWQEGQQFVVFRDVPVRRNVPLIIEVAPAPNGIAVLNGMQVSSRGTRPPHLASVTPPTMAPGLTNLVIREVKYDGKVSDDEARFDVALDVESMNTNLLSTPLFTGELAVIAPELPEGVRIGRVGGQYRLFVSQPGTYHLDLQVVAKIKRAEPWNEISFVGPPAAIASVAVQAASAGVELQLLSGTALDTDKQKSRIEGFLGGDRTLSLRWQSKGAEVTRKALVTVDSIVSARISASVVKLTTTFRYEILQANLPQLTVALPTNQALTRLEGEQIRDWQIRAENDQQILTVDFIKPVEKSYALTLHSEQTVETTPLKLQLAPPQPLGVQREAGSLTLSADETIVEIESTTGLRQINASTNAFAAYRFYGRPVALSLQIRSIQPVLNVAARTTARLEETRLLISHALNVTVEKAGIYALELTVPADFVVADVKGEGVEDWKSSEGKLRISFNSRVLGPRNLDVQLEKALNTVPDQITILPVRVLNATKETAQIGAISAPGVRLKTGELVGLREIPITQLSSRTDELLAFNAEQPDWKLTLSAERLPARVVAEVFNLITIGDGLVGGSATVRYGLINQGVQQFRLNLPRHWKNIEFTGPNIRRKEEQNGLWVISLQDKAWGGYTLVVTYDYQFDPQKATLDLSGAHPVGIERESGSVAVTTAASLRVQTKTSSDALRLIDQTELSETDRAFITRPVLLAYRYTGEAYNLAADVTRFETERVLEAVADRTQLTTVLTEGGEMLTQASFMVKNNDKQFQKFQLPAGANFWGCYVNGQPAKPEKDGDWLLVSLPREANRDQAFAVDIVYAEKIESLKSRILPKTLRLQAPKTDVPNTYAEWQLFTPPTQRLSSFDGNMTVARGTTYDLRDSWNRFLEFYGDVWRRQGLTLFAVTGFAALIGVLVVSAIRRGRQGVTIVLVIVALLAVLSGMLLPSLGKGKAAAQRARSASNLKQIALAARMFADDHQNRFPVSFEEMQNELGTEKILTDPQTGQRYAYIGGDKKPDDPNAVLAYSPAHNGWRTIALADGSVQQIREDQFAAGLQVGGRLAPPRDLGRIATVDSVGDAAQGEQTRSREYAQIPATPAPAAQPGRSDVGTFGAAGAGPRGAAIAANQPAAPPSLAPTVTGIRSIRIDVPKTGHAFTFTKVLHLRDEPLAVEMSVVKAKVFNVVRSAVQIGCFVAGLILSWVQWRRSLRSSFWMAVGFALVGGSLLSMFVTWRALHLVFIAGAPILALILFVWIARRWLPARSVAPDTTAPAGIPPAVAVLALLGVMCHSGFAQPANLTLEQVLGITSRPPIILPQPTNAVSILSASYQGTVRENTAQFEASLQVSSRGTNQIVPLFGDDLAIQHFTVKSGEARLLREGRNVSLLLTNPGNATLELKFVARLSGDVTKRRLAFAIPPALFSQVTVTVDEPEADVEFPSAVSFKRSSVPQGTRVEAIIGSDDRVDLQWTPRVKRAAEIAATVFVQNKTLITLGLGVVNTRATLDYQISQGELRQARVRLPEKHRLLRVEGNSIRTWEISPAPTGDLLQVELLKGVSPEYKLTVETEAVLEKLPATVILQTPHALDVKRETGILGVRGSEELTLTLEAGPDLQRVDIAEFSKNEESLASAFRFLKPEFQLTARAEVVQPQIEAVVRNNFRVGPEEITLSATIDYTIKRAGVFAFQAVVPAGYRIETVTGANLLQWVEKMEGTNRLVEVALKERTAGLYTLQLTLRQLVKELPRTVNLLGAHPRGVGKLTGFISVSAEPGVAVKTGAIQALTEIPAANLDDARTAASAGVLAYKFISTEPGPLPVWNLSVATETVEAWVRAEVANMITVSETMVSGRSLVRYDVQNAPVKEFRLKIPSAYTNVEIMGANIRRRDQQGNEWRVELQNKVRGQNILTVTWEQPRSTQTNVSLEIFGVEAVNVERETGYLAVFTRPPLQVTERAISGELTRIDARELPDWTGVSALSERSRAGSDTLVLAYRYLRPGYKLTLNVTRFQEAAVLQALVDSAQFTTVVADDGQMMTEMNLSIRNNGRQFLEIELPKDSSVWSAFVAGQPVRPSKQGGKLLLPLEGAGADAAAFSLELTYVGREKFPRRKGQVLLDSPTLDVPLKNARWNLYLPPDYEYEDFEGTMTHEREGIPMYQSFSLVDYSRQEATKLEVRSSEMKSSVSNARSELSRGNVKEANVYFKQSKDRASGRGEEREQLGQLEQELRKAQSSNLITAQRAFTADNLERLAGAQLTIPSQKVEGADIIQYDANVAEQQWMRLQQAQEIAVSKIEPLRVNLPTRGQRHSFTQVLQTEIRKPLSIRFEARNQKKASWPKRLFLAAGGFGVLWIAAARANGRRLES